MKLQRHRNRTCRQQLRRRTLAREREAAERVAAVVAVAPSIVAAQNKLATLVFVKIVAAVVAWRRAATSKKTSEQTSARTQLHVAPATHQRGIFALKHFGTLSQLSELHRLRRKEQTSARAKFGQKRNRSPHGSQRTCASAAANAFNTAGSNNISSASSSSILLARVANVENWKFCFPHFWAR